VTTGGPQDRPTDEEVRAALEEQMRRLNVQDVLLQTVVTLVNLGARKLGLTAPPEEAGGEPPTPDLEQTRQAIEATRALLPLVSGDLGPIRDALSQLQVAYARLAQGSPGSGAQAETAGAPTGAARSQTSASTAGGSGGPGTGAERDEAPPPAGGQPQPGTEPPGAPSAPDPEREKARSKIWTPPGV
jgi:hypothetical protein